MSRRLSFRIALLVSLATTLIVGCGKSDIGRKDVWGTVTWRGQAVPAGVVIFEPDSSKGNRGPLGFTTIQDGRYDTRTLPTFKGCIAGPSKVMVQSGDGKNKTVLLPYGHALFLPHVQSVEVPENGGEINLVVPVSVPPLPANYDPESG